MLTSLTKMVLIFFFLLKKGVILTKRNLMDMICKLMLISIFLMRYVNLLSEESFLQIYFFAYERFHAIRGYVGLGSQVIRSFFKKSVLNLLNQLCKRSTYKIFNIMVNLMII